MQTRAANPGAAQNDPMPAWLIGAGAAVLMLIGPGFFRWAVGSLLKFIGREGFSIFSAAAEQRRAQQAAEWRAAQEAAENTPPDPPSEGG